MPVFEKLFDSREVLAATLAQKVAKKLSDAIEERGEASLLVSGGSTPKAFFDALSSLQLAWNKVVISLVDERWVAPSEPDSNARLVTEHLLVNQASVAQFVPLYESEWDPAADSQGTLDAILRRHQQLHMPFDVIVLGMGDDMHTASLFPCCQQLDEAYDLNSSCPLVFTKPTTAPYVRISHTLKALISSRNLFLHIVGQSKYQVLQQALEEHDDYLAPIAAVARRANLQVMWAE